VSDKVIEVLIGSIVPNRFQPRREFGEEELRELADSIQKVGMIHSPVVRSLKGSSDKYEIIAGERRWRASKLLGLEYLTVILKEYDDQESAKIALIENIQRVDLNAIEVASSIQSLIDLYQFTQKEVALKIGKKRSSIANYLRILTLPEHIQQKIKEGSLSLGHAKVLLSLEPDSSKEWLCCEVLSKGLSVRETEKIAKERQTIKIDENKGREDIILLEKELEMKTHLKVNIQNNKGKGKISLKYSNLDELDLFLSLMGIEL